MLFFLFDNLIKKFVGFLLICMMLLIALYVAYFNNVAEVSHFPLRGGVFFDMLVTMHLTFPMFVVLISDVEKTVDCFVFEVIQIEVVSIFVACALNCATHRDSGMILQKSKYFLHLLLNYGLEH